MNIGQVRQAMADALAPIEANVSAYASSSPTPPALQIIPPSVAYDYSFARGLDEWEFIVQAVVAFSQDVAAQMLLDELIQPEGDQSIKALLEADRTLGDTVESLRVVSSSRPAQVQSAGGSPMLTVEFLVQVIGRGE